MKVFVFEYAAGGGFAGRDIPPEILCDGYGMFKAFISDLKALGCQVTTTLDHRLKVSFPQLGADETFSISLKQDLEQAFQKLSTSIDAAMVIAPETRKALGETVKKIEEGSCQSLNCPSETIQRFQGKSAVYRALTSAGVRVPRTIEVEVGDNLEALRENVEAVGFPAIVKPDEEAGCTGLSLVQNSEEVSLALNKVRRETSASRLLVQEYLKGHPASVSLLCTSNRSKPLTLNRQWVILEKPSLSSRYLGGFTPYDPSLNFSEEVCVEEAVKAASALPPLRGYVGVDMVLTPQGPVVVDINLRLTTSYLGVRKVVKENVATLILDSAFQGILPEKLSVMGGAIYRKIQVPPAFEVGGASLGEGVEVFLPPTRQSGVREGFLVTYSSSLPKASQTFYRVLGNIFKTEVIFLDLW